jgi:hypothetical protein
LDVYLANAGFSVIGYEPNDTNREVARHVVDVQEESIASRVFIIGDLPEVPVDLIWCCHVLEHVPKSDWGEFFGEVARYNCGILISVPLGHAYYVPSHVNIWNDEQELVKDLESSGFTVKWSEVDYQNSVIRVEIHG